MAELTRYRVNALPDSGDLLYQLMADGDIRRAVREGTEHLLRTIATYSPGSATLAIRYVFTPKSLPSERQSRLAISLVARAPDERVASNLRVLIECSDLRAYYGLQPNAVSDELPADYRAVCDVTRTERAVQPLHGPESNPAIPTVYYLCHPFVPQKSNDYLLLDRILDRVTEPAMFEAAVEPASLASEQLLHTRDLARLQSINRTYDFDEDELAYGTDPFETETHTRANQLAVIKPLRHKDPIADDILRERRRLHETLGQPHLRFHLRVLALSPAVAQLIASAVAESAFTDGSYHLWPCDTKDACFPQILASVTGSEVFTQPTLDRMFGEQAPAYRGLERLGHVATVDELLSAFALPVASRAQTRCIRKNTEPAPVPRENLLILGRDE